MDNITVDQFHEALDYIHRLIRGQIDPSNLHNGWLQINNMFYFRFNKVPGWNHLVLAQRKKDIISRPVFKYLAKRIDRAVNDYHAGQYDIEYEESTLARTKIGRGNQPVQLAKISVVKGVRS